MKNILYILVKSYGGFLDIRLFRTIYDILEQRIELPITEEKKKNIVIYNLLIIIYVNISIDCKKH